MFNIIYDGQTGEILQYQEGGTPMTDTSIAGKPQLSFAQPIPQLFNSTGYIVMRVNVQTQKLEYINPVQIPDPISNPSNVAMVS